MPAEASDRPAQLPARGDEAHLFATYAPRLRATVRRMVRTSSENVEDACSFAFLQLLRYQPDRDSVYAWLVKVAAREAVKLDLRTRRTLPLEHNDGNHDVVSEPADRADTFALRVEVTSHALPVTSNATRSSPAPASSRCCSGACSPAARTTPTSSPR